MEDIQDGIKASIQDGKIEDPKTIIKGKTGLALAKMVTTIMNPKIESVVELSTDSTDLTASIATIIELAVT